MRRRNDAGRSDSNFRGAAVGILAVILGLMLFPVAATAQNTSSCSESGNDDAPYACSSLITDLSFDCDSSNVVTEGLDSDLFAMTWQSNDLIYVQWGDGEGLLSDDTHFSGTDSRWGSSYGIGAVTGSPVSGSKNAGCPTCAWTWDDLQDWRNCDGCEDRSNNAGKIGGILGVQATGSVPAMLYMTFTPQGGDEGRQMAFWDPVADLGSAVTACPTMWPGTGIWRPAGIAQIGQGYNIPAGAFDNTGDEGYIYVVLTEFRGKAGSDDTILGRVAIPSQNASDVCAGFEYISGIDGNNVPTWDSNIGNATSIFHDNNGTQNGGPLTMVYVADLDRYVMAMAHRFSGEGESDRVSLGAVGWYEAETPWGPWKTIKYYHDGPHTWCDIGDQSPDQNLGHHMVEKWFENGGSTFFTATSANCPNGFNGEVCDTFNLIEGTFTVGPGVDSPDTPAVSQVDNVTDTSALVRSTAFSHPDGAAAHAGSQWQVDLPGGSFSSPVQDSGMVTSELTAWQCGGLDPGTAYVTRVRHRDDAGAWSSWSAVGGASQFQTTGTNPLPSVVEGVTRTDIEPNS